MAASPAQDPDPALPQWRSIQRLVTPLDAARLAMRDRPDTQLHRRSSLDAAGLVLSRCIEEGTAYWGWPEEAWVRLIGEDRHAFARPWPGWVDQTVRPYVAAYGCDFGAFHRLGAFNRIALVERVFGREAVAPFWTPSSRNSRAGAIVGLARTSDCARSWCRPFWSIAASAWRT